MINKQLLKNSLSWGFILWLIGYILGFILFFIVPPSFIGWVIAPIGIIITLLVLFKKIKSKDIKHYFVLAIAWTLIAIVLDYFFIVKALNPADGYYKPDVYLYYFLVFVLPIFVGWWKRSKK
jgi:uncharacterized membrane protein